MYSFIKFDEYINEEINFNIPDKSVVYHKTQLKNLESILINGFSRKNISKSGGNIYGPGIYTSYKLETSKKLNYGDVIIKCKIMDIKNTLCFVPEIAKKLYGKRFSVEDQIKSKHNINNLNLLDSNKLNIIYNSNGTNENGALMSYQLTQPFKNVIYYSNVDGLCFLTYDFKNLKPIEYSLDNGKTWKLNYNKTLYNNMKNKDIIYDLWKDNFEHVIGPIFKKEENDRLIYLYDKKRNKIKKEGFTDVYVKGGFIIVEIDNMYNLIKGNLQYQFDNFIPKQIFREKILSKLKD
ncbi:MAG: hypothetical protein RSC92_02235 [Clostridia bacterium]